MYITSLTASLWSASETSFIPQASVVRPATSRHQQTVPWKLDIGLPGQLSLSDWPHYLATWFWPALSTMVTAEPLSYCTRSLWCVSEENVVSLAIVCLWQDANDVASCDHTAPVQTLSWMAAYHACIQLMAISSTGWCSWAHISIEQQQLRNLITATLWNGAGHCIFVVWFLLMVALWNRADHYIFILWFLSSSI